MTTPPAAVCGHPWLTRGGCAWLPEAGVDARHRCQLDPEHLTDPGPMPRPHRCGCGALTPEETR